ncbi:lysozyme inhibitor LprI family protein [Acidovorax radicis]|uniref:lysozyme inhibitor LprI family protein n=1 Tax=Acidovorax radicis TaxID=758826 RepID=UPI001CF7FFCA|nr:lysozyme inhibitor LprI family protein [Acidovorax radicis]UCU97342.1 DUF1311 domain-containing protein [Acidovorax radicis]
MQIFKMKKRELAMVFGAACVMLMGADAVHAQAGAACKPGGSVDETNACAVQAFQAADTQIAILYGDVMRALSAHERPQLRQEHTAWQRERTTRCKQAMRSSESQPQWPRLYHECLAIETEARRKGLMRWLTLDHPSAKP